jgi:hypothetical protein
MSGHIYYTFLLALFAINVKFRIRKGFSQEFFVASGEAGSLWRDDCYSPYSAIAIAYIKNQNLL